MSKSENSLANSRSDLPRGCSVFVVDRNCKVIWHAVSRADCLGNSKNPDKIEDLADFLLGKGIGLEHVGEALSSVEGIESGECEIIRDGAKLLRIVPFEGYRGLQMVVLALDGNCLEENDFDSVDSKIRVHFSGTPQARQNLHLNALNVLVVDDNALSVDLSSRLLKKLECNVVGASSGGEALALSTRYDFDLVFMDLRMPGIGGIETTRLLKQRSEKNWGHIPTVVGLSAYVRAGERDEAMKSGMDCVRLKPVSFEDYRKFVENVSRSELFRATQSAKSCAASSSRSLDAEGLLVVDLSGWDGERELHLRMVETFKVQVRSALSKFRLLCEEENWSELEREIHYLKGGADIVKAQRISALSAEALRELGKGKVGNFATLSDRFEGEFSKFEDVLRVKGYGLEGDSGGRNSEI